MEAVATYMIVATCRSDSLFKYIVTTATSTTTTTATTMKFQHRRATAKLAAHFYLPQSLHGKEMGRKWSRARKGKEIKRREEKLDGLEEEK